MASFSTRAAMILAARETPPGAAVGDTSVDGYRLIAISPPSTAINFGGSEGIAAALAASLGTTPVHEAPNDGQPYARMGSSWIPISTDIVLSPVELINIFNDT